MTTSHSVFEKRICGAITTNHLKFGRAQLYYKNAEKFASERVETTDDPSVLAALYVGDVRLDKAVGVLVTQGAVQGRPSNGEPGGPNAFDEVTLENDSLP